MDPTRGTVKRFLRSSVLWAICSSQSHLAVDFLGSMTPNSQGGHLISTSRKMKLGYHQVCRISMLSRDGSLPKLYAVTI